MGNTTDMGARAILIGAGHFPKDESLKTLPQVAKNLLALSETISTHYMFELDLTQTTVLSDTQDNVGIKEELAAQAEEASKTLFIYYTGHVVLRKGQLYLTTASSSCSRIHVNGISLDEVVALIKDSSAKNKVVIIDAVFSAEGAEMSEKDIYQTESRFRQASDSVAGLQILISSPQNAHNQFEGGGSCSLMTTAIIKGLQDGIGQEREMLFLSDIHSITKLSLEEHLSGSPVLINEYREDAVVGRNQRFLEFQKLNMQGNNKFDQNQFSSAYPLYTSALDLFPENEEASAKRQFIDAYQEGQLALQDQEYDAALKKFEEAKSHVMTDYIHRTILETIDLIATKAIEDGKFDLAKSKLETLVSLAPKDDKYRKRLDQTNMELEFSALVDEGDQYYFQNDYQKATDYYQKALAIKDDAKTSRRRSEAEAFLLKEESIKVHLESRIREEMEGKLRSEADIVLKKKEEEVTSRVEAQLRGQLKADSESEIGQARVKNEEAFWAAISLWNDKNAYKFYLGFFKDGKHREKAEERFQQLQAREIKAKEKQEEEAANIVQLNQTIEDLRHRIEELEEDLADQKTKSQAKPIQESIEQEPQHAIVTTKVEGTPAEKAPELILEEKGVPNPVAEETEVEAPADPETKTLTEEKDEQPVAESEAKAEEAVSLIEEVEEPLQAVKEETEQEPQPSKETPKDNDSYLDELFSDNPAFSARIKKMMTGEASAPSKAPLKPQVNMSEQELWDKAVKDNTSESYMYYVDNTSEGNHVADAYYRINEIKHPGLDDSQPEMPASVEFPVSQEPTQEAPVASIDEVQSTMTPTDSDHTSGDDDAAEEELWKTAQEANTLDGYFVYINNTVQKKHWDEARGKLNELKNNTEVDEQAEWEYAKMANTIEAYQNYIQKYPLGNHYAQAMFKINKLKS